MKKIIVLAAVAALALFTSCEQKIDSPLVGGWNTSGQLTLFDATTGETKTYDARHDLTFFDNGKFQFNSYITGTFDGAWKYGTWSVKGDQLTMRTGSAGLIQNNTFYSYTDFQATEETVTWEIKGHYLYLTHANEEVEEYYDGSGAF